jgi:hypothetical protein
MSWADVKVGTTKTAKVLRNTTVEIDLILDAGRRGKRSRGDCPFKAGIFRALFLCSFRGPLLISSSIERNPAPYQEQATGHQACFAAPRKKKIALFDFTIPPRKNLNRHEHE